MYDQEIIFGNSRNLNLPLTFKQFLLLALGIGTSYLIDTNFETNLSYILILIVIILTIIFLFKFRPTKITSLNFDAFFEKKRREMSPESYVRFIQKNIAQVQSQIYFRKNLGYKESQYLNEISGLLENLSKSQK